MKRLITFCIISFGMLTASMAAEKQPTDYVNPFIGTTNFALRIREPSVPTE